MSKQPSLFHAIKWSYSSTWGDRVLASAVTFILAAILGPRDFGLMTLALVYIGFAQMCLDQGLVIALIQKRDLEDEHLDSVFWMTVALGLFLLLVTIVLSPWWALINHVPELSTITRILGVSIVIESLTTVQIAVLKREMNFRSLAIRTNVSALVGGAVGIGMAFSGAGMWALVGQQVARDGAALLLLWRFSSWRPKWRVSIRHIKELIGFSGANFLAQLASFVQMQAGVTVLGSLFGPVPVGLYRLAERLRDTILKSAASSIQAVSLAEFSRLQDNPSRLKESVLTCVRLSAIVTLPTLAGLSAVGVPLSGVMGADWRPAASALSACCWAGMTLVFVFFTGPLLQALGRGLLSAVLEWGRMLLAFPAIALAAYLVKGADAGHQAAGIAAANFLVTAVIVVPVYVTILLRFSGLRLSDVVKAVTPACASAIASTVAVMLVRPLGSSQPALVELAVEVGTGGTVGILTLLALDAQIRVSLLSMIRRYRSGLQSPDVT